MRFMLLMYPDIRVEDGDEWAPDAEAVAKMGKFNEDLTQAGVLLSLDGLYGQEDGARVSFTGGQHTITDGPFTEAKEVVGGYWLLQVKSKEEAVQWATRCPTVGGDFFIEVRRVYEMSDFTEEVQAAAELSATPPEQTTA